MIVPVTLLFAVLAASGQQGSAPSGTDVSSKASSTSSAPVTSPAAAKPADPASPVSPASDDDDDVPVSLKRIQRALSAPPMIKVLEPRMHDGRPVYRVDVEADKIDLQRILGKDYLRGVASYGGMTHQEFLDLVTPNDVKGYAAFSNAEGLTVAATSIALQWAVLKAIDALKKAKSQHEEEEARKEVQTALESLRQARRAAGLPDK